MLNQVQHEGQHGMEREGGLIFDLPLADRLGKGVIEKRLAVFQFHTNLPMGNDDFYSTPGRHMTLDSTKAIIPRRSDFLLEREKGAGKH